MKFLRKMTAIEIIIILIYLIFSPVILSFQEVVATEYSESANDIELTTLSEVAVLSAKAAMPSKFDLRDYIDITVKNQHAYGICYRCAEATMRESHIKLRQYKGEYDWYKQSGVFSVIADYNEFGSSAVLPLVEIEDANSVLQNWYHDSSYNEQKYLSSTVPVVASGTPQLPDGLQKNFYEIKEQISANKRVFKSVFKSFDGARNIKWKDENNKEVDIEEIRDEMKAFIMEKGGLSVDVYTSGFGDANVTSNGIYTGETIPGERTCFTEEEDGTEEGSHGVTIIGWDDSYSRLKFSTGRPKNDGAWIVQNSWGENWGQDGIFYVSYEDASIYRYMEGVKEIVPLNDTIDPEIEFGSIIIKGYDRHGSGIKSLSYMYTEHNLQPEANSAEWISPGVTSLTLSEVSDKYLWVKATDKAGNEIIKCSKHTSDNGGISIQRELPAYENDWLNLQSIKVYIDRENLPYKSYAVWIDNVRKKVSSLNIDTSNERQHIFTFDTEGEHTIYIAAVDVNGYEYLGSSVKIKLDKSKPRLTANLTGRTITGVVSDGYSGLKSLTINEEDITASVKSDKTYEFTVTEPGTYTVIAVDNVGNANTRTVYVPEATSTDTAPTATNVTTNSITVKLNQTNADNAIETIKYGICQDGYSTFSWGAENQFTGLKDGTTYKVKTMVTTTSGAVVTSKETKVTTQTLNSAELIMKDEENLDYTSGEWTNKNITIGIAETDKANTVFYSLADSVQSIEKTKNDVVVNTSGTTKVKVDTSDGTNLKYNEYEIKIDKEDPILKVDFDNGTKEIIGIVSDKLSGISSVTIDGTSVKVEDGSGIFKYPVTTAKEYTVIAIDEVGNYIEQTVTVNETASTATAPTATNITTNSITIQSNQKNEQDTIVKIKYGICINNIYYWQDSNTFNNLYDNTVYKVKTMVTTQMGNIKESDATEITTKTLNAAELIMKNLTGVDYTSGVWVNKDIVIGLIGSDKEKAKFYSKAGSAQNIEERNTALLVTENGTTTVEVKTTDGYNTKYSENAYVINIDKDKPVLEAEYIKTSKTITGTVSDEVSGVSNVTINGNSATLVNGVFTYSVTSVGEYEIIATDLAGNQEVKTIIVEEPSTDAAPTTTETTKSIEVISNQINEQDTITKTLYAICISDVWSDWQESDIDGKIIFDNLKDGTVYKVKTKVITQSGNEQESKEKEVTTKTLNVTELKMKNLEREEYKSGDWSNKDIVVELTGPDKEKAKFYSVEGSAQSINERYTALLIDKNGTTTINVKTTDGYNTKYSENEYVIKIDKDKPALEATYNRTSKTITGKVSDSLSGVSSVSINGNEETLVKGAFTYSVTSVGEYEIIATDLAGNQEVKTITVEEPSTDTAPTVKETTKSIEVISNQINEQDTITKTLYAICKSGVWSDWQESNIDGKIIFDNLNNGTLYRVKTKVITESGNEQESKEKEVTTKILNAAELIMKDLTGVEYTSGDWTNKNIYIELTGSDKEKAKFYSTAGSNQSIAKRTEPIFVTENGTTTVKVETTDGYNTKYNQNAYVIRIDKNKPILKAEYNRAATTITGIVSDELSGISNVTINGNLATLVNGVFTYSIASVGEYEIIATDLAGNQVVKTISIEETSTDAAPTAIATTKSIEVTSNQINEQDEITEILYAICIDNVWYWQQPNKFDNLEDDTEYKVKTKVKTKLGNVQESKEKVISTKKLNAAELIMKELTSVKYTSGVWINKDIVIGLTGTDKEKANFYSKAGSAQNISNRTEALLVTENGTTTVEVETTDGYNTKYSEKEYVIKIDKEKPVLEIEYNKESKVIEGTIEDIVSGLDKVTISTGENTEDVDVQNGLVSYYIAQEGEYTITAYDKAGNNIEETITIQETMTTDEAPTGTSTTKSIKIISNQTNADEEIVDIEYAICIDGVWSDWQKSDIFDNLKDGTTYRVKTKVTTESGKEQESKKTTVTTKELIQVELVMKNTDNLEYISGEWSNKNVVIEIADIDKQKANFYSIDNSAQNIQKQNSTVTVKTNGITKLEVATTDGYNIKYKQYEIRVDKQKPDVDLEYNKNSKTIIGTIKDELSGLANVTINGDKVDLENDAITYKVTEGKTYEIIVIDEVGNSLIKKISIVDDNTNNEEEEENNNSNNMEEEEENNQEDDNNNVENDNEDNENNSNIEDNKENNQTNSNGAIEEDEENNQENDNNNVENDNENDENNNNKVEDEKNNQDSNNEQNKEDDSVSKNELPKTGEKCIIYGILGILFAITCYAIVKIKRNK